MELVTNLLGRKIQIYGSNSLGQIVGIYLERGDPWLIVENAEGGLYTCTMGGATLVKEEENEEATSS